jgi:hypothetical protein
MVAGGIFLHRIEFFHGILPTWPDVLKELTLGVVGGLAAVAVFTLGKGIYSLATKNKTELELNNQKNPVFVRVRFYKVQYLNLEFKMLNFKQKKRLVKSLFSILIE